MNFQTYDPENFFDEYFEASGNPQPWAKPLIDHIDSLQPDELLLYQHAAQAALMNMGITFNVYSEREGTEKTFPFDILPRIVNGADWAFIEKGLQQRIRALNLFIHDVYNEEKIFKEGVVPKEFVLSSEGYRPECKGIHPPKNIWCHITGTDLVRDKDGQLLVLEDNLRCPSGVSYVLGNRRLLKETFPQVFETLRVRPIDDYPNRLLKVLQYLTSEKAHSPNLVILTPGIFNSAYFEHSFLAQSMGIELVEGSDLAVFDDYVHMRTTEGFQRVDAIYRRIDDDFLDPETFRSDSTLGVPGLMKVFQKGNVVLINAPGTGVADDKAVYAFVPKIIKFYLGEEPILPNVPTYLCGLEEDKKYVLDHLDRLIVKETGGAGGSGMLIGHLASSAERNLFAEKIRSRPRNYIAQEVIALSRAPVIVDDRFEGRHIDLRPFILFGEDVYVLPGGLTRVALKKGSLVVNSSQGGGSKDTWVLHK